MKLIFIFFCFECSAAVFDYPLDKKNLRVCLINSPITILEPITYLYLPTKEESDYFEKVIDREYNEANTGVYISEWNNCTDNNIQTYDVVLYFTKDPIPKIKFFNSGDANPLIFKRKTQGVHLQLIQSMTMNLPFEFNLIEMASNRMGQLEQLNSIILHEMGHIAGLRHEHEYFRKEALADPKCKENKYNFKLIKKQLKKIAKKEGETYNEVFRYDVTALFPYDSNSIMNYCHVRFIPKGEKRDFLSSVDKETLRYMYP